MRTWPACRRRLTPSCATSTTSTSRVRWTRRAKTCWPKISQTKKRKSSSTPKTPTEKRSGGEGNQFSCRIKLKIFGSGWYFLLFASLIYVWLFGSSQLGWQFFFSLSFCRLKIPENRNYLITHSLVVQNMVSFFVKEMKSSSYSCFLNYLNWLKQLFFNWTIITSFFQIEFLCMKSNYVSAKLFF